jgi:hypothetical protein
MPGLAENLNLDFRLMVTLAATDRSDFWQDRHAEGLVVVEPAAFAHIVGCRLPLSARIVAEAKVNWNAFGREAPPDTGPP